MRHFAAILCLALASCAPRPIVGEDDVLQYITRPNIETPYTVEYYESPTHNSAIYRVKGRFYLAVYISHGKCPFMLRYAGRKGECTSREEVYRVMQEMWDKATGKVNTGNNRRLG